jgi:SOS-response transcriptional repressor LexA
MTEDERIPARAPVSLPLESRAAAEREKDALVSLAGEALGILLDGTDSGNAAFLDWWARELRARDGAGRTEDASVAASAASSFADAMRARLALARIAVRCVNRAPVSRAPSVQASVASSVREAESRRCAPALDLGVAAGVGRELWDEPCERWVELPPEVAPGQHVALTVAGESMVPLLHAGDTVLVKLGPELARDAVVVARHPEDGYVVKRVGTVGAGEVQLLSLNPQFGPMTIPRRDDLVLGTVILRWCPHAEPARLA